MIDLDSLDGINIITDYSGKVHTLASEANPRTENSSLSSMSYKNENLLTCMLITANVGTIFEESDLLELWFQQLKSYLTKVRPQLVAIHCQEVGGKNYESSMKHVSSFIDKIIGDESMIEDYTRVRIFLDENFESLEKFTALGSLYLIHDSVKDVKLYNFRKARYESVPGREIFAGDTTDELAEHVEKVKFPQDLFPECRWSRKGFMRTRWLFNNSKPLDLVNIHLFHDASNIVAMEQSPSPYAQNRQRALEFTLERISIPLITNDSTNLEQSEPINKLDRDQSSSPAASPKTTTEVPLFIFGDFNFRLDTNKVVQRITEGAPPVIKRKGDSNEVLEIIYHRRSDGNTNVSYVRNAVEKSEGVPAKEKDDNGNNSSSDFSKEGTGVVMTVGKKLFDCENLDETFRATKNTEWLLELDNELDSFKSKLFEFKISFSPSYPFKEDSTGGYSYMKTRCPAWCDRILFNAAGVDIIYSDSLRNCSTQMDSRYRIEQLQGRGDITYRLMGNSVPMGDHKPVLLYCQLDLSAESSKCNTTDSLNHETINLIESTAM